MFSGNFIWLLQPNKSHTNMRNKSYQKYLNNNWSMRIWGGHQRSKLAWPWPQAFLPLLWLIHETFNFNDWLGKSLSLPVAFTNVSTCFNSDFHLRLGSFNYQMIRTFCGAARCSPPLERMGNTKLAQKNVPSPTNPGMKCAIVWDILWKCLISMRYCSLLRLQLVD